MQYSSLQILYATLAIMGILLGTHQNILSRPLSLLSTSISFYVYYSAGLYAKLLLNCVYIVLGIYGWYYWLYGGKNKTRPYVTKSSYGQLAMLPILWLVGAWGLGQLFAFYSNAVLPYWDSLHTVMALTAHWLTNRKKLESWLVWALANVLYAWVLYHRELYVLSGLHCFYNILAINGYYTWYRSYKHSQSTMVPFRFRPLRNESS